MVSSFPPPLPPATAKRIFIRRILPVLLAANVAVGVYVLTRTSKNRSAEKDADADATEKVPSSPSVNTEAVVPEKTVSTEIPAAVKVLPPVPEHEQRELFKWILEERRKVKPHGSSEKQKIDEEKALLKQIINAKSIPSL